MITAALERPLIYDQDLLVLERTLQEWGEPAYRARQIWQGIYHNLWDQPEQFRVLPENLRNKLGENFRFNNLTPSIQLDSRDGETKKTLFTLPDSKAVEAVLMRYAKRRTLCISTQAGCAMGCVFCATGQMGFLRHLSSGEIIEQVLHYARLLQISGEQVTNIVIMGMGEPFHNYDATMHAIDRLNDSQGYNFGARRFTISTVGLVPAIRRFGREQRQVNLAISLHAADNDLRSSLLPINRKYPLEELISACQEYVATTHRRLSFEWALIQGVNDSIEQARKLSGLLQVFRQNGTTLCHVNMIPLNPTHKYTGQPTTRQQALAFQAELEQHGIPCTIRIRRGIDIQAGCGQLATLK
jgi:23S rRNA (adenine2503-C2)-methyltransferase